MTTRLKRIGAGTVVTAEMLQGLNACEEQVSVFMRTWPEGAQITLENIRRAQELGLDIEWWSWQVLSAPARKAYDEAVAPARKAYGEAIAPARKAYGEAIAPALYKALTGG